jgi:hypothetical protein
MIMRRAVLVPIVLLLAACAGEDSAPAPPAQEPAADPTAAAAQEPTADAVWQQLQTQNYRSWPLFPGTTERYRGTDPHGAQLTTYVNELARGALAAGTFPLPDGSIIVKENYMPDGTFDASTVMLKRQGFNPQHNDWFWAKYDAAGTAEVSGRVEMCEACHGANRDRDYLMTAVSR